MRAASTHAPHEHALALLRGVTVMMRMPRRSVATSASRRFVCRGCLSSGCACAYADVWVSSLSWSNASLSCASVQVSASCCSTLCFFLGDIGAGSSASAAGMASTSAPPAAAAAAAGGAGSSSSFATASARSVFQPAHSAGGIRNGVRSAPGSPRRMRPRRAAQASTTRRVPL
jgi:hypothetical protein